MNTETIEIVTFAIQRFSETHPRPSHVTQTQAAEMLDLSRATISRMVHAGTIRLNKFGMIPITEIDRLISVAG